MFDEVMSILQKSIRRSQARDACFWAAELHKSGMGTQAMNRLCVIMSEDVSLSVPMLPVTMNRLKQIFFEKHKQKDGTGGAKRALMEAATVLALSPKCQMANNACGASLAMIEQAIEKADPVVTTNWERFIKTDWSACEPFNRLKSLLEECSETGNPQIEDQALTLLQRLCEYFFFFFFPFQFTQKIFLKTWEQKNNQEYGLNEFGNL